MLIKSSAPSAGVGTLGSLARQARCHAGQNVSLPTAAALNVSPPLPRSRNSGKKYIQWAVVLTGFTVGFCLCSMKWLRSDAAAGILTTPQRRISRYCNVEQSRYARLRHTHGFPRRRTRPNRDRHDFSTPIWVRRRCLVRFWQATFRP